MIEELAGVDVHLLAHLLVLLLVRVHQVELVDARRYEHILIFHRVTDAYVLRELPLLVLERLLYLADLAFFVHVEGRAKLLNEVVIFLRLRWTDRPLLVFGAIRSVDTVIGVFHRRVSRRNLLLWAR